MKIIFHILIYLALCLNCSIAGTCDQKDLKEIKASKLKLSAGDFSAYSKSKEIYQKPDRCLEIKYEFAKINVIMFAQTKNEKYIASAKNIFLQLNKTNLKHPLTLVLSSEISLAIGQYDEAIIDLLNAKKHYIKGTHEEVINQYILTGLGYTFYLKKDWAKAKEYFHKHLQSPKHSNYTYVYLAYIAYEEDDIAEFYDQYRNFYKYPYSEHYDDSEERKILDKCYRYFFKSAPPEWTRKAK